MLLKNLHYVKSKLLNLSLLLLVFLFTIFNGNAQTLTCQAETDLSINCNDIGNPTIPQIQEIPGLEQVMMPPYNMEISGILPQTGLVVEDSAPISFCISDAREISRLITIYNDINSNFAYDVGEEIGACTYTIMTEAITEPPTFSAPADIETPCELGSGVEVTGEPILSPDACSFLSSDISFADGIPAISECPGETLFRRTWTISDQCGNQSEHIQEIYLFDREGPSLSIPPDITVPCGTDPMDNSITGNDSYAYDFCEGVEVEVSSRINPTLTQENTPCPGSTTYIKSWGALDFCGNATQKQQIIVVECQPTCNADPCVGDITREPLPGECGCQFVEAQVLGCMDPRCPNSDPNVNCDDGSCSFKAFDLSLRKELTSTETFTVGTTANITFTITIYNEGNLLAQNIELIDYIPAGLILNDANWTPSGVNAVTTLAGPLSPGSSISIEITFTIDTSLTADTYINYAEITGAQDISGNSAPDIDSTPDTNNDFENDNEDDHDGAEFTVVAAASCPNNNAGYFCE